MSDEDKKVIPRFIIDEFFLEDLFKDVTKAKEYIIKLDIINNENNLF